MKEIDITPMTIDHYQDVLSLWQNTEGLGLSDDDGKESISSYLDRNPGLSFVAIADDRVVGAVLCGHDGRRGSIYHLAVSQDCRRLGIGKTLVDTCIDGLKSAGIRKCNIFVFGHNIEGQTFWQTIGWNNRSDIEILQKFTTPPSDSDCKASC